MLLENQHIRLRAIEPEDLNLLYQWENNPNYWYAGEIRAPHSKFTLKQYILSSGKDIYENKQIRFMIESKELKKIVGTIDLFDLDIFNSRIGVGLLVDEPFQQNGFASMSLDLIQEYVISYLKIHQVYAHVAKTNEASIALFESCGFEKTATLKEWIQNKNGFTDIFLYQYFSKKMD